MCAFPSLYIMHISPLRLLLELHMTGVMKAAFLIVCLFPCLCDWHGHASCWLDVAYLIGGWMEMKADPSPLSASRPWSSGDAAHC